MLYYPDSASAAIATRTKWTPAVVRLPALDFGKSDPLPKRARRNALRPAKFDVTKLVFFERRSDALPGRPAACGPRLHRKQGVDAARCAVALCLRTQERKPIERLEPKTERRSTLGQFQKIVREA